MSEEALKKLQQKLHNIEMDNAKITHVGRIIEEPEDEYTKYVKSYELMPEELYYKMCKKKGWTHINCQIEAKKRLRNILEAVWGHDYGDKNE